MLSVFSKLADGITVSVLGFSLETKIGKAVHFFIEDSTKIFALLLVMIYSIALIRASLKVERVRDFLSGQRRILGYFLGSGFGAVTPFCSCSSIPVFLGFTSAGIPLGMTMAFLLTSPLINEVAIILLLSLIGWQITIIYLTVALSVGIFGGIFLDLIHGERLLQPFVQEAYRQVSDQKHPNQVIKSLSLKQRHEFAKKELIEIYSRVWKWVILGVGLGAVLHGYIPEGWIESHLGQGQWWSVPMAVLIGIPLYSNATGVIPVMESLIINGLPIGTTLAFSISTVAASFPEFILLKQVMQWRLMAYIIAILLLAFTLIGWVLNFIHINY